MGFVAFVGDVGVFDSDVLTGSHVNLKTVTNIFFSNLDYFCVTFCDTHRPGDAGLPEPDKFIEIMERNLFGSGQNGHGFIVSGSKSLIPTAVFACWVGWCMCGVCELVWCGDLRRFRGFEDFMGEEKERKV